jgi:membrane-associated phospholipid phosphatase
VLKKILNWDYNTFRLIHLNGHNALLDFVLPYIRNPFFWGPLYIFIAILMYQTFGRKGLIWLLFFLITFAISDFVSASIIKPIIHRVRPCNDVMWLNHFRNLVPKSHGFSFPSSHATNHFALAVFIIITCRTFFKHIVPWALLWAGSIAYAQVYVGVHYPVDVLCGALLGTWAGYITGNYFNLHYKL